MAGQKIEIPFNEWSRERLKRGLKTATSRTKRLGKPGDWFVVDGRRYVLTIVERAVLGIVKDWYYKMEGCTTPEEFVKVWKSIHPRAGFKRTKKVWLHIFERKKK